MAKRPITIQLEPTLIERIDGVRGTLARQAWIAVAVERALSEAKEPTSGEQADPGSVSSLEGVRSAAPAEQPIADASVRAAHMPRSSTQAKRGTGPRPKGEK